MAEILIVDDEVTIRELFRYVFEDAGYVVSSADNGCQALALLTGYTPDFMLLDVSMPEMSGPELAMELKRMSRHEERLKNLPFVVMTGENFMDAALNQIFTELPGFVCFMPKMTPPEKVLEKAQEVLGRN